MVHHVNDNFVPYSNFILFLLSEIQENQPGNPILLN